MMKLVVGTEGMLFLSLMMAFVYLSYVSGFEPGQQQSLDIKSTGIFSLFLLSSSGTFWLAERNYNKGDIKNLKKMVGRNHSFWIYFFNSGKAKNIFI